MMKSAPMLFCLLLLFSLTGFVHAQHIREVIFICQEHDEPPTQEGRPKYILRFERQLNGELLATSLTKNAKEHPLPMKIMLEKERTERVMQWIGNNKNVFTLSEVDLNIDFVKERVGGSLNFPIPEELEIKVDSFLFCRDYLVKKVIGTGGTAFAVTIIYDSGQETVFKFDSGNHDIQAFDLRGYIICYSLLHGRIPENLTDYDFFTKEMLAYTIVQYQQVVECEGYYYKEYIDRNPNLTAAERRMRKGWDFVEYLKDRNVKD